MISSTKVVLENHGVINLKFVVFPVSIVEGGSFIFDLSRLPSPC